VDNIQENGQCGFIVFLYQITMEIALQSKQVNWWLNRECGLEVYYFGDTCQTDGRRLSNSSIAILWSFNYFPSFRLLGLQKSPCVANVAPDFTKEL
jgi:hypothetical protein